MNKLLSERQKSLKHGITFETFVDCIDEYKSGDELAILTLDSIEAIIEDAQRCGYYLVEE